MPMKVSTTAGGDNYANPFIGPIGPITTLDVDLTDLTNKEVDADGILKPGVPLTKAGELCDTLAISTIAQGVNAAGGIEAVGNGTVGAATGGYNQPSETITATFTTTGATAKANVYGSKSGYIGELTVGTAFHSPQINVTAADGATDFTAGNVISWVVTGGDSDKVYGVTVEATKLVDDNGASLTGTYAVVVTTAGLLNRDIVEDILGRALTATEIAGFAGSPLQLTNT